MKCSWIRGGTSKGLFFNQDQFPFARNSRERDQVVRKALGFGGNGLQLDGIGGGLSSTSKVAFVGTGRNNACPTGFDLTYDFGQVNHVTGAIDWRGNCGNLASALVLFARGENMLEEGRREARVWQVNVQQEMRIKHLGYDIQLAGLNSKAEAVRVEFAGDDTRSVLPTGNAMDMLRGNTVAASLVLGSNPTVFVLHREVSQLDRSGIEALRQEGALRMNVECNDAVRVAILHPRRTESTKEHIFVQITVPPTGKEEGRMFHHAITGTGAANLAIAARIPGTLCHSLIAPAAQPLQDGEEDEEIIIGHASGTMGIGASAHLVPGIGWCSRGVSFLRSARVLMRGEVDCSL